LAQGIYSTLVFVLRLCFLNSVLDHSRTFQTYLSIKPNLRFRECHRQTDRSVNLRSPQPIGCGLGNHPPSLKGLFLANILPLKTLGSPTLETISSLFHIGAITNLKVGLVES
jgi:hypothetical protein